MSHLCKFYLSNTVFPKQITKFNEIYVPTTIWIGKCLFKCIIEKQVAAALLYYLLPNNVELLSHIILPLYLCLRL